MDRTVYSGWPWLVVESGDPRDFIADFGGYLAQLEGWDYSSPYDSSGFTHPKEAEDYLDVTAHYTISRTGNSYWLKAQEGDTSTILFHEENDDAVFQSGLREMEEILRDDEGLAVRHWD